MSISVAGGLSSSHHAATQPSATTQTTYRQRCMENLSLDKVTDLENQESKWNKLATISTVAFFALAIASFIATSVLLPAYLPLVGIGAITAAFLTVPQIQKFRSWAGEALQERSKYEEIQHQYAKLTAETPMELQRILLNMGIIWNHIPGISDRQPEQLYGLTPILAHAKYLEAQTLALIEARDEAVNEAQGITADRQMKAYKQQYALQCEDRALKSKIKNAFYQAVLRDPQFTGTFEGIGSLSKINVEERMLGNALNDAAAGQLFAFSNNAIAPISYTDAKTMTVAQLGQRFFTAMHA
jgi:hypothetical protein